MEKHTNPEYPLARILAMVEKDGDERFGTPQMKSVTTRVELQDACRIDALAAVAGGSRASVLEHLLLVGLEEVLENLKKESLAKYFDALEVEYSRAFPSAYEKVEALGKDDENVTKADLVVHDFIEAQSIAKSVVELAKGNE